MYMKSIFVTAKKLNNGVFYGLIEEREIWSDHEDIDDEVDGEIELPPGSPGRHDTTANTSDMVLVRWLLAFFLLLQANFHIADRVMNFIFVFMKTFFLVLGRSYAQSPLASVAENLPRTFYMAKKSYMGLQHITFQKIPICKQCGTVWKFSECVEHRGLHAKPKFCSNMLFGRSGKQCKGTLLKTVELASKRLLPPHDILLFEP